MGFVIWSMHILAWFVISYLSAVIRGHPNALHIRVCVVMGTLSALLHGLIQYYVRSLL